MDLVAEADLEGLGLLVELRHVEGIEVADVVMDSREVTPGALFCAVRGRQSDGHGFVRAALADGAVAAVCDPAGIAAIGVDCPAVVVHSVRRALGPLSHAFFGHPSARLVMAGVTGTNGKTTAVSLLGSIFAEGGWRAGTIGTLSGSRTTPEAPALARQLAGMAERGVTAVAMEVSSHALSQHRVDGISFDVAVFTNLSPEHLDYHASMEDYFEAKARLFEPGRARVAVVNADDSWGQRLVQRLRARRQNVVEFGLEQASDLELDLSGSSFTWEGRRIRLNLAGRFNVYNALAAACAARALGVSVEAIARGLETLRGVPGRFQTVCEGQEFDVVIDYAHTPDGLAKALQAARELARGRVIVVFGAGGERDREKRPLMGAAAARYADLSVVTSDNPRHEDPEVIIASVLEGFPEGASVISQADRREAIALALSVAAAGDVVVVAGKGHEKFQEVAGRRIPFDDLEVVRASLAGFPRTPRAAS